jgi:HlyD family secretion protein
MNKTVFLFLISIFMFYCSGENPGEIEAPGIVDGDVITMKSLVPGQIRKISIQEGDQVEKNALVMAIDSDKTENKLESLNMALEEIDINETKLKTRLEYIRSSIDYLEKQVQRFTRLKEKKSIPGEKLESMELKLKEARTSETDIRKSLETLTVERSKVRNQKEYLELVLQDYRIKSPVKGVIIEKFVSGGETVFPGSALFDILDITSMYIEIFIEEREMGALELDQKATIRVDGIKDRTFEGTLTYFGKKAEFSPKYVLSEKERESLLYRAKIALRKDLEVFKLGMPVTVILARKK